MGPRLLHAEELARFAGVHKSTVLLAIRRGELKASRTVGRSARIAPEDARAYLAARGCAIPPELTPEPPPQVAVITAADDVVALVRAALPPGAALMGSANLYASLVALGAEAPRAVVLDLDIEFMNPIRLLAALRAEPSLRGVPVAVVALRDELVPAARAAGAAAGFRKVERDRLAAWIAAQRPTPAAEPPPPPPPRSPLPPAPPPGPRRRRK